MGVFKHADMPTCLTTNKKCIKPCSVFRVLQKDKHHAERSTIIRSHRAGPP